MTRTGLRMTGETPETPDDARRTDATGSEPNPDATAPEPSQPEQTRQDAASGAPADSPVESTLPSDEGPLPSRTAGPASNAEPVVSEIRQQADQDYRATLPLRVDRDVPWRDGETLDSAAPGEQGDGTAPGPELQKFGEYELLQEIARGGMGVVYRARQSRLNRTVALKMILSGQLASREDVQRFYLEAEAAASLEHPGIVPIYEIGEHEGQHFFSMGFIDGAGLDVRVKDGPMPPREAAAVTQQVCEAIAYAHSQNVIHRDLKPANVLIDGTGQAKVTDFGLARKTDADSGLTGTGQILGTPGYMPPEQVFGGTDRIGPAADIYSLGATLYTLLTGRPPFQSANVMDTLEAVLKQEPVAPRQLNPSLDVDLETICLKCLEKEADRRYATTDELVAELGRYLNGEPIHARPIGKLERGWRWCQRKPALAGLGVLAVVLLLTLGIGGPLVALEQSALRMKAEQALSAQLQAERERRVVQARSLREATPQAAAAILRELDLGSRQIQDTLRSQLSDNSLSPLAINRMRLGLLPVDAQQLEPIVEFVLSASGQRLKPDELLLIRDALTPHGADVSARFLPSLKNSSDRLRAGCFLAGFAADGDFWPDQAENLAADLVRVLPSELTAYRQALRPVRKHLIDPLSAIYRDDAADSQVRAFATETLVDYLSEDAEELFDLLADANEQQFGPLFTALTVHQQQAIPLGNAEVARSRTEAASENQKESLAMRQANAAVMLLRMKAADHVWPLLKHSPDPRVRSYLIHWLSPRGGNFQTILNRYGQETDVTIKRALLLCLGEFDLPDADQQSLIETLVDVYRTDPDSGLHAASEWLLRHWDQADALADIDKELQSTEAQRRAAGDDPRQWYINGQGQTYAIFQADEFAMGSSELEANRSPFDDQLHRRRIGRRIAIATKEVTRAQWRVFFQANPKSRNVDHGQLKIFPESDDSPMAGMTWYEAAWYCNWLSGQEGIPESQWCYEPNTDGVYGPGMKAREKFWELSGYRLPTESEWEFSCRAGAVSDRYYGRCYSRVTAPLLPHYAWHQANSKARIHPVAKVKPNDLGLFDMLGNVSEWCYDEYRPRRFTHLRDYQNARTLADTPATQGVPEAARRVLRGAAFHDWPGRVRSAARNYGRSVDRNDDHGFRPARTYHLFP